MRTARLATFIVVISALLLNLTPLSHTRIAHAQNSTPASRMYCTGFKTSTNLYRVDNYGDTPTAVYLGSTGKVLTDIAITPSGVGYAITVNVLYRINLENGQTTLVRNLPVPSQNSLAASEDKLFMWGFGDIKIRVIDLTKPGPPEVLVDPGRYGADLALAPGGIFLYGAALDNKLIRVNLVTKEIKVIGQMKFSTPDRPVVETGYMSGLGFASDGQLYGTRGNNAGTIAEVYKIDVCTAETNPVRVPTIAGAENFGNGGMAMTW